MKTRIISSLFFLLFALTWASCDREDKAPQNPLTADAGEEISQAINQVIELDGTGSRNSLGASLNYQWSLKSKPNGSQLTLSNAQTVTLEVLPDLVGTYVFELTVNYQSWTDSDQVRVEVTEAETILINGDILEDLILSNIYIEENERFDYLVDGEILVKAKLTIEAGVKVGFHENAKLTIHESGSLIADSNLDEVLPIVLVGKEEEVGFWQGIVIQSSSDENLLKAVEISNAGKAPLSAALTIENGAKLQMTESKIHHNSGIGMDVKVGAILTEFNSNEFVNNEISPLKIDGKDLGMIGVGNDIQGEDILVTPSVLEDGMEHIWPSFEADFRLLDDLLIRGESRLILSAGTHLNMDDEIAIRINSGAKIHFVGEATAPVIIRGVNPIKGAWKGISISGSQGNPSSILYTEIYHAGSSPLAGQDANTIQLGVQGELHMEHSLLSDGRGNGLEAIADGTKLSFVSNIIKTHLEYPLVVSTEHVEDLDYNTQFIENGKQQVEVDGLKAIAKPSGEFVWRGFSQPIPYVIQGLGKDLMIQSGVKMLAGVEILMTANTRIDVQDANGNQAYLQLEGHAGKPVRIGGVEDVAGFWYGITYSSDHANNHIKYATISNAGKPIPSNFSAALTVDNVPRGSLKVENTTIRKSGEHGIAVAKVYSSSLEVSELEFLQVAGTTIYKWGN